MTRYSSREWLYSNSINPRRRFLLRMKTGIMNPINQPANEDLFVHVLDESDSTPWNIRIVTS